MAALEISLSTVPPELPRGMFCPQVFSAPHTTPVLRVWVVFFQSQSSRDGRGIFEQALAVAASEIIAVLHALVVWGVQHPWEQALPAFRETCISLTRGVWYTPKEA